MAINIEILHSLIKNQKDAIRYQIIFASIVLIVGIILIITSLYFIEIPNSDTIKSIMGIGGSFITSLAAFPVNHILTRLEKIRTYKLFCLGINNFTEIEILKIEELIWKSIEKNV